MIKIILCSNMKMRHLVGFQQKNKGLEFGKVWTKYWFEQDVRTIANDNQFITRIQVELIADISRDNNLSLSRKTCNL